MLFLLIFAIKVQSIKKLNNTKSKIKSSTTLNRQKFTSKSSMENINAGHRDRVKNKILKSDDLSFLNSYEIIELLLFYCNKRSDVKPLAKQMDAFFGSSIHNLLNAKQDVFTKNFTGIGASFLCLLKIVKELQSRNRYEQIKMTHVDNLQQLVEYLRVFYNQQTKEIFKAIFLDANSNIITEKIMSQGTINQAVVYPREILKECLNCNAAYVIVSHNHPSNNPTPSKEDLAVSLEIKKALNTINVALFDSLIITKDSFYSFKKEGFL